MHRDVGQLGFADQAVRDVRSRMDAFLGAVEKAVDWRSVEDVVTAIYDAPVGRPSYPPLVMVKMLLLRAWFALSDVQTEDQARDRLSFRRFLGLPLEGAVPDHSTLSRFRDRLVEHGLSQALFTEIGRQLAAQDLVVKEGTLIDASLIKSAAATPRGEHAVASEVDPDARFTKRGGTSHFGYKLHVAVDAGSRLIRAVAVTPGNVNDCVLGPALIQGDERVVYADKGYDSQAMRSAIAAAGAQNGVMRRPNRHHKVLLPAERRRNRFIAPRRSPVEGVFGTLKRNMALARAHLLGLAKVTAELTIACLALNLRRAVSLTATP